MLKDWNNRTHNTDFLNLDRNKFGYKKNCLWKKFCEILKSEVCTKWEKWRQLENFESTKSQYKNWEKVMRQCRSSLPSWKKCKSRWILWVIEENFKKWVFDYLEELKLSRSVHGKDFPNFEMLDAKIASALKQKAQKEDRFPTRKTDRLHDRRLLSSDWRSWYSIGLRGLFSVILHVDNIQEFDKRRDEILSSVTQIPSDDLGKLVHIENTWVWSTQNRIGIVRHGDSSEDIGSQLSKIKDQGEEEKRSETSITKLWRWAREKWIWSCGQESRGIVRRGRRKRYLSPVERKGQIVFARRPLQFPPRNPRSCAKTRTHCRHICWAILVTRTKCVEEKRSIRGKSNHGAILRQPCRYYLKGTCSRSPCEYWHPPECHFYKAETGCKAGDKCHNWVAARKTQKHWYLREENCKRETRCKKSLDQFEKCGSLSQRHVKQASGKRRDRPLEKYKSEILISEVPTLWNLRTGPMKRLNDNSDAPEAKQGTLPKTYTSSNKKTKLHSTRPRKNGYSQLRQQESEEREFVVDSGSHYAHGQQERP